MKPSSMPRIGDAVLVDEEGKWQEGTVVAVSDRYVTIRAGRSTHHVPLDWYREDMGWKYSNRALLS